MKRVDVPGVMIEGYNYGGYLRHNLDGVVEVDRITVDLVKDDPARTVLYSNELGPHELSDQVMELFTAAYGADWQNARSPE